MLNIRELHDLLTDKNAPAEDNRATLIVIALVEQRIVLERIAELLDVRRMDCLDIEAQLGRIATAFEDHNNRLKELLSDPPDLEIDAGPIPE